MQKLCIRNNKKAIFNNFFSKKNASETKLRKVSHYLIFI